nr:sugar transferase [Chitinophagaceae bacterium]
MSISSPHKAPQKTYRHFSVAPSVATTPVAENTKLDFFYIGKRSGVIDSLIKAFESGYAAENAEQARSMLKRLTIYSSKGPDVIIAEGSLGHNTLFLFHQFISSTKHLNNVPFFVEGSDLTAAELEKFGAEPFADDVISLKGLGTDKLLSKIRFWKRIRQRISAVQVPVREDAPQVRNSPADFSKRTFDIVISALLMVLLSPVFLMIIVALKMQSKGPVFYTSKRAGRGYNISIFTSSGQCMQ